jgi:hypothetical protein
LKKSLLAHPFLSYYLNLLKMNMLTPAIEPWVGI